MKDDLWELPSDRLTSAVTDATEAQFYSRCEPDKRPRFMQSGQMPYDEKEEVETDKEHVNEPTPKSSRKKKPRYDESLFYALLRTFASRICWAGSFKLCGDTLKTTTPLVSKVLLAWLTNSYVYHRLSDEQKASGQFGKPQGIGYGIGVAFALFAMQEIASLMTNHYFQSKPILAPPVERLSTMVEVSQTNGLLVRTSLIGVVFRKSLRLSGRAKLEHSVGKITTMISTDATRLDRFTNVGHNLWVSPIQIVIGIGLLLGNLGYSALVGLGVLLLGFPVQFVLVRVMFTQRKKAVAITDKRIRLTTEVLQGIRLIKFYAWESFYIDKLGALRSREIKAIRKANFARSILIAIVTFIPILAAILSFITYALTGHDLDVAIIFSSLQLFNIIRQPLTFFPFVLSAFTDALVALGRISKYLLAEELAEPYPINYEQEAAVSVDGEFTWEAAGKLDGNKFDVVGRSGRGAEGKTGNKTPPKKVEADPVLPISVKMDEGSSEEGSKEDERPFELKNLKFSVPKGAFVVIVGRVGSGKSSVLQALIGEMRKTKGKVLFGGNVAYVPQTPWIRNATLRENVLFGLEDDEERFREVIRACNLEHDLGMLPNGEYTEIGEKGINLSGGQKARVSLARAAYSESDVVLLDDPLSAVDAYVGKAILEQCILNGPLANRTRILVTHVLHVIDKADYIYVMDNGLVTEHGTYHASALMTDSVVFSRLMDEYGSLQDAEEEVKKKAEKADAADAAGHDAKKSDAALMQTEERNTGSVTWKVYGNYLHFSGGIVWAPIILILLTLVQGAQVANNIFLGLWTAESIRAFHQGDYMAVYAGIGVFQAVFAFVFSFAIVIASSIASLNLFRIALTRVLYSPTSFFDTTPIGRVLSRLSKDQDTLDTELANTTWQFLYTASSVLGTVVLVFYTFPYLGIIFAPMIVLYWMVSVYYRRTSVETKRLDSLIRSTLYGSFSETLTGLSTIRAYRAQDRAIKAADAGLDLENRAYYMTISIQRWLSVRLDMFGNILVLGIALFAAGFRNTVDPSKIGVVLSYTLSITQVFSDMIAQFAQNEQNMNAVERVLHYAELPPEGDATTSNDPPASWPCQGHISFNNVKFAYREGLPLVLKGVTFDVKPGEKVGIVGRTGAGECPLAGVLPQIFDQRLGKSSLLQALFRTVELQGGKIEIDGQDISSVGLNVLRGRIALVPQDSTLFLGTLRDNLDPQGSRTDAELISVLQRAWLLPADGTSDPIAEAKFSLDSTVGDEGLSSTTLGYYKQANGSSGANFSVGEKQLLALCRALVKNSRIIILDEATSSVDVETDAKLQKTIQREFATSTLLCIAHRLNTIAYYDRVIVMDSGEIAEFDTVLNLYDNEQSIFRSLCNEANLQRADILKLRADHRDIVANSTVKSH
ncbi:hypothetical protein C0995_002776 [Termitomyces sp. Mi166|nr:hypothetical protein C0995_002776 [Termitomyces sp. Mi166\